MEENNSPSDGSGGSDPIPSDIRQHFNDLFDAQMDKINRLRDSEEKSLQDAVVRRQNSAGKPAGFVDLYGKRMERMVDAWISAWVSAYSFVNRVPDGVEQKEVLAGLEKLLVGVVSSSEYHLKRLRQLTNDSWGPWAATAARLQQRMGVAIGRAPRDLRLAVRSLTSKLQDAAIHVSSTVPAPPAEILAPPAENCFRNEGSAWRVRYGGKEALIKDSKGMVYIHELLLNQGRELSVVYLAREKSPAAGGEEAFLQDGLSVGPATDADEVLDKTAIEDYKRQLTKMAREREEANASGDLKKVAELNHDVELIENELRTKRGIGGRSRKFVGQAERARQSVREAIKRAKKTIRSPHQDLAAHLDKYLHTGYYCRYLPDQQVLWEL